MEHSFNIELASKYGVEEAVVIQNLFFWINKNVANDKNFYDGRYWTYNSAKAFAKLFPYLNESKLFRILKSLQDDDIIIKGNYNKEKFDRTGWYTFTDNGISILEKLDFHFSKMQNGFSENKETIPDNKQQIINTDIKESTYVDKKKTKNEEEITNEDYRKFRIWMNENCPYCNNPRNMPSSTITQAEFLKLKSEYSGRDIAETILEIENRKDLRKKYANLYRTTLNWLKNRNK
jgi:hypothetical protein